MVRRLEKLDASTTEARAAQLLHGLGFTKTMQNKATKDFSGGLLAPACPVLRSPVASRSSRRQLRTTGHLASSQGPGAVCSATQSPMNVQHEEAAARVLHRP